MSQLLVRTLLVFFALIFISSSLSVHGAESRSLMDQPFRTVKFVGEYIFFTTNNGRSFGYINVTSRGEVDVIYVLEDDERIVDEFTMGNKLIIGNRNKSLTHFEPFNRTFQYDERFVGENFTELRGYKQVNDKAYIITENALRYYHRQADGNWVYVKQLIADSTLNPGIVETYHDLYFFPTKKFPERVFILTTAVFQNEEDVHGISKLLSCFKWFNGEEQIVDGSCSYEELLDVRDFRISDKWAYMRMGNQTFVYDETLTMKTKWQQIPTQYVYGHAVTADHLTYLYKTNELAYYRLVENYKDDDIKMTTTDDSINILKKNKRLVKFNKAATSEVIGSWLQELDEMTFQTLIQFNTGDLHCYKVIRSQQSTEINYLFRIAPEKQKKQVPVETQTQQAEQAAAETADATETTSEGTEITGQQTKQEQVPAASEAIDAVPIDPIENNEL